MMRLAAKAAKHSDHKQHHLGAVIVKGNRVLSTGYNQLRPSALLRTRTVHAEAHAVLKLLKEGRQHELVGADIYVTRFTRGGVIGMAKPCEHCHALLRSVGIRNCSYTNQYGETTKERL